MQRLLVCLATVIPISLAAQSALTGKQRLANDAFVAQDSGESCPRRIRH